MNRERARLKEGSIEWKWGNKGGKGKGDGGTSEERRAIFSCAIFFLNMWVEIMTYVPFIIQYMEESFWYRNKTSRGGNLITRAFYVLQTAAQWACKWPEHRLLISAAPLSDATWAPLESMWRYAWVIVLSLCRTHTLTVGELSVNPNNNNMVPFLIHPSSLFCLSPLYHQCTILCIFSVQ